MGFQSKSLYRKLSEKSHNSVRSRAKTRQCTKCRLNKHMHRQTLDGPMDGLAKAYLNGTVWFKKQKYLAAIGSLTNVILSISTAPSPSIWYPYRLNCKGKVIHHVVTSALFILELTHLACRILLLKSYYLVAKSPPYVRVNHINIWLVITLCGRRRFFSTFSLQE